MRRTIRANPTSSELKELALLDSVMTLMKTHGARLFVTVIVKREGREFDGQSVYMHALHEVVRSFHGQLVATDTFGTAIADFRETKLNGRVSVELLEAKLGPTGDPHQVAVSNGVANLRLLPSAGAARQVGSFERSRHRMEYGFGSTTFFLHKPVSL